MLSNKAHLGEWKTRSIHNAHIQFSSIAQSCVTLFDSMNRSMPGLSVHHQLPTSTQIHVHWVGDAIQPSHPLSSPSPPALNISQHQSLFKWVSSSHQVAKVLEFQLQHLSFQWTPRLISSRMDWLDLLAVQGTLKSLLKHHSSKASILWCSAFFIVQLSHPYMTTGKRWKLEAYKYGLCSRFGREGNGTPLLPGKSHGWRSDRLQSMGSQRVRHDWATSLSLSTFMHWRRKWQPTPLFLSGESQGRWDLVGCHLWGCTESDTTEAT